VPLTTVVTATWTDAGSERTFRPLLSCRFSTRVIRPYLPFALIGGSPRSSGAFGHRAWAGGLTASGLRSVFARDLVCVRARRGLRGGKGLTVSGEYVGRRRELRLLDEALTTARNGEGRLIVVSGEAGIGKTRFCREVASHAERAGCAVAWGACWPDGGAPPLWPWQAVLADLGGEAAAALLAGDPGGPVTDPERFARFAAAADYVSAACARSPVLVVIDDVHGADPGAVLLARFIGRGLARLPLVLLIARRPEESGDPAAAPLLRDLDGDALVVNLRPFDADETAALLRSYGYFDLDHDLEQALWRLTGGNPLFLERVVALGPARSDAGELPHDDVRAAIAMALDRLDEAAREILSRASVLGLTPYVPEAVVVADCTTAALSDALGEAERVGLVTVDEGNRFSFTHQLVEETLRDRLTVDQRCEAHARAADMLGGQHRAGGPPHPEEDTACPSGGPANSTDRSSDETHDAVRGLLDPAEGTQDPSRYAHHALRAAARSARDARRAVAACRAAAATMVRGLSYERASSILEAAARLHEQAGLREPAAALLVEWAQAVLASGQLLEARRLFDRAAEAAMAEGNKVELARAALGLGGVWVSEHRTRPEWERVTGLQRRALEALPADERELRHRLTVRLAAEEVYRGAPVEPVLDALEQARRSGTGGALAEALSLCHHALLTPRFARRRLALAEELNAVASPAGEGMLTLLGHCWRTVDLFHLGDPGAPRALAELRQHADALNCRSILYIVHAMETMLLIRAGRLEEAEAQAQACFRIGTEVGDADALGYLGAHLVTIRWLQDRDAEMLATIESIANSPTLNPAEFAFQATVACLAARAGEHDKARLRLGKLTVDGLASLPESSTWLAGLASILETAHVLGDADVARQGYELLLPYADLPIMPSLAVTCLGSAERPLGLAALTIGRIDNAVEHLDRAVTANRNLGNRPVTALTSADLADALVRRGRPGDHERAARLLAEARLEAETLGMSARALAWKRRLGELDQCRATIRRQGRHWLLNLDDRQAIVGHRIGMAYLAELLTKPGRAIPAAELASGTASAAADGAAGAATGTAAAPIPATPQPLIDDRAQAAYRRRVNELVDELAEAERNADIGRAEHVRAELDALAGELRRVTAKGGRIRSFPDPRERARTAVRKAIKRAIDDIAAADPAIGDQLRSSIRTGTFCTYAPDPGRPLYWVFE
jgi:tetratricopeptide (TPR) repeat protein